MNLMLIEQSQITLGNFENLAAQPADDTVCRQQIIALDAVLVARELSCATSDALGPIATPPIRTLPTALPR